MKKAIVIMSSILTLFTATAALASSNDDDKKYYSSGNIEWMSIDNAKANARKLGYEVRYIERDDGYYEIKAIDKNGRSVEIYMHPSSGKIIKIEKD